MNRELIKGQMDAIRGLFRRLFNLPPEKLFLVVAIPFGLAFLFLIPPFQSPDEQVHFFRAFQLKTGDIRAERIYPVGAGGMLPSNMNHAVVSLLDQKPPGTEPAKYNTELLRQHGNVRPDFTELEAVNFPNTSVYSPLSYSPHIIGLLIADDIFSLGLLPMMYIARFIGFVVWLVAMFYMIRIIPLGKWVLVVMGLIPTMIYEAVTINIDTLTTVSAYGFVVLVLYLYVKRVRLRSADYALLICTVTLLNLTKPGYFIVTALALILIKRVPGSAIRKWGILLGALVLAMIPFLLWFLAVKEFSTQIPLLLKPGVIVDPYLQVSNVINNPGVLLNTFVVMLISNYSSTPLNGFIGSFGWIDYPVPTWMVALGLLLIAISLVYTSRDEAVIVTKDRLIKWYALTVFVAAFLFILTLLYLTWTPVGLTRIDGIQGRYFIPLIPLLIPVLQSSIVQFKGGDATRSKILIFGSLLMLVISVVLLIMRFWI